MDPLTPPLPPPILAPLVEDIEAAVDCALVDVEAAEAREPPCLGILSALSNCELLLIPFCFDDGSEGGGPFVTGLRNGRLTRSFDFA